MARWAPDARQRFETAAFELFDENGYEVTTVAQIAERAGLNRATFFRHFTDKREVLFGSEEHLADLFAAGVRDAPQDAPLLALLRSAIDAAGEAMTPDQHDRARRRVKALAESPEVQERGALKRARTATAIRAALVERGVDAVTARLAAGVAIATFSIATEAWIRSDSAPFPTCAAEAFAAVQESLAALRPASSDIPGRTDADHPVRLSKN